MPILKSVDFNHKQVADEAQTGAKAVKQKTEDGG